MHLAIVLQQVEFSYNDVFFVCRKYKDIFLMNVTYNIMGSTPLRELAFIGNGKCADLLDDAGFFTVADVRLHTLSDAARILQQAIDRLDYENKTHVAFKAFRGIFTVIQAKSVADDIPHCFQCPISHDWMVDPVITPSGITYDRSNIDVWITSFGNGPANDPMTGLPLASSQLVPNRALADAISRYRPLEERFLVNYEEAMRIL